MPITPGDPVTEGEIVESLERLLELSDKDVMQLLDKAVRTSDLTHLSRILAAMYRMTQHAIPPLRIQRLIKNKHLLL